MNRKLVLIFSAFFSYFVFGFSDNLKGPLIPEILSFFSVSYSVGSNILLLSYLAFMIATMIMGPLSDREDNRVLLIIAGVLLALGLSGSAIAQIHQFIYLSYFILGLGLGSVAIVANAIIVDRYPTKNGFYLNLLSFFHSLGAMTAPIFAGKLISSGVPWPKIYLFTLILPGALFILLILSSSNDKKIIPLNKKRGSLRGAFTPEVIFFAIGITAYVAAEIGIAAWIVEFLQKVKDFSVIKSSLYLSVYFGFLMIGRLIGSTFVDRVGHIRVMKIFSVVAVVASLSGVYVSKEYSIILPLTGLFLSILFPTMMASASERNPENKGKIFGILFFFAGLGGMLGPWGVGRVAHLYGIKTGMLVPPIFLMILVSTLFIIGRNKKVVKV